ncbi:MAG: N-acetyltransferase [Deltaproteobacteria bacterium]|nr:N-acetyltransferase [Deltaproteobacteria bacterium]
MARRVGAGHGCRHEEVPLEIRQAREADLDAVLAVERAAFGTDEEAELVRELLGDPTAHPLISLLAFEGAGAVGHILLTRARLVGAAQAMLLAPVAVVPGHQKRGIGGALIEEALRLAGGMGVGLVFVLGHPTYYPRHGFEPAGRLGLETTFPIPEKNADAWMVQALVPGLLGSIRGRVACADVLNKPEYWRE